MIIETIQGNLVSAFIKREDTRITHMAHGCNCFHTMGSGIAGEVARVLPEAYAADLVSTIKGDRSKLGTYSTAVFEGFARPGHDDARVFNLYTQYSFGGDRTHVDYDAIKRAFEKLNQEYGGDWEGASRVRLGIPKIGAGLARGNWSLIETIINNATPDLDVVLFIL